MAGFDYRSAGPPTFAAPSAPAHCYDYVNDVLYTSSFGDPSSPAVWVVVGANAVQVQGRNVSATAPSDGQALVWSAATQDWEPGTVAGSISGSPALGTQVVGNGSGFASQTKPVYDVRDWATCDGVTNATAGMQHLLVAIGSNPATIAFTSGVCVLGNLTFPANVTLDFSQGGSIQPITDSTPPGGGAIDTAGSATNFSTSSNICSVTVTPSSAGEAYYLFTVFGFGSGATVSRPTSTNTSDAIPVTPTFQSNTNVSSLTDGWLVSDVAAGTRTFTFTYNIATWVSCGAIAISGIGPTPSLVSSASAQGTATPMSSGAATVQSGSFILGYGGQHNNTETCTAGAGFTQPAGTLGQIGTSGTTCLQYINSSSAGSLTANQNISSAPTGLAWTYNQVELRPGSATVGILGGIGNPALNKIFYNATPGQGTIDFTGATVLDAVYPEWWGASPAASASTNTPALQAAIYGAFGQQRTNASGLSKYNRPLYFNGNYQINDELKAYHLLGFRFTCDSKLNGGITQTATNKRIFDGQSWAYGIVDGCRWATTATQNVPLIDMDYSGLQGIDLATQNITFYDNVFSGNGLGQIGLLNAKSGGGAQGDNVRIFNTYFSGFTLAGFQIGGDNTGLNVGRLPATNAIANLIIGGDSQANPQYGYASYGGSMTLRDVTMENGFQTQTGFDVYCNGPVGSEYCVLERIRSESRRLAAGSSLVIRDSYAINQAQAPDPSTSFPVGTIISGSRVGGDGHYYKVTVDAGNFSGVGTPNVPVLASSGSSTTLADTNQTVPGSVTIGTFVLGETVTQSVTGASATLLNAVASVATVTGSVTSGTFIFNETLTQSVTGVTATEQAPSPTGNASLKMTNLSGTADAGHTWIGGTSGAVYTPTSAPSFAVSNPPMLISSPSGSPDGSHTWIGGTSGAVYTPTGAPSGVNWTVNAFAGMRASLLGGAGIGHYCVITSNTATDLTCAGGWVTQYDRLPDQNPNSTSLFIIESNWGTQFTSGGITWVDMNENVLDGSAGAQAIVNLDHVALPGGRVHAKGRFNYVDVTCADWAVSPVGLDNNTSDNTYNNIQVFLGAGATGSGPLGIGGGNYYVAWKFPRNLSAGSVIYKGGLSDSRGTVPIIWSAGGLGGGLSCDDVWIGGRSDPNSANDHTRAVLEFGGMLGRAAGFGTNQTGTDTDITGGPSTGTGNGGAINFYTSNPGSTGATVNSGLKRARINSSGQIESLLSTGSAPLVVASTTQVSNLNVSQLEGKTWEVPGTIGSTTPNTLTGTTINYTTALQHNGTPIQVSDLSDGSSVTKTIASGTSTLGTSGINATTCATAVTTSATGTASTDSIEWAFNAAPGTGYTSGLTVLPYVTTDNVNFLVCNATAGTLTPAAATLNWRVLR